MIICKKVNEKKYLERNSPPYHANECPNEKIKGNDKKMYISKKDKNGIYKWVLSNIDVFEPKEKADKNKGKILYGKENRLYISEKDNNGEWNWKFLDIKMKKDIYDYFKQFPNYIEPIYNTDFFIKQINLLKKEMAKNGVLFYYLKWGKDSLDFDHHGYIIELIDREIYKNPKKYPNGWIYSSDLLLYNSSKKNIKKDDGIIHLNWSILDNVKSEINDILIKIFPKRTTGIVHKNDAIIVYINEQTKIKQSKDHKNMVVQINFKDKKLKIENKEAIKLGNDIAKQIGKKYINNMIDIFEWKGKIELFYEVYDDKIKEFAEKFKILKIKNMPEISEIVVKRGDLVKIIDKWIWKY